MLAWPSRSWPLQSPIQQPRAAWLGHEALCGTPLPDRPRSPGRPLCLRRTIPPPANRQLIGQKNLTRNLPGSDRLPFERNQQRQQSIPTAGRDESVLFASQLRIFQTILSLRRLLRSPPPRNSRRLQFARSLQQASLHFDTRERLGSSSVQGACRKCVRVFAALTPPRTSSLCPRYRPERNPRVQSSPPSTTIFTTSRIHTLDTMGSVRVALATGFRIPAIVSGEPHSSETATGVSEAHAILSTSQPGSWKCPARNRHLKRVLTAVLWPRCHQNHHGREPTLSRWKPR